VVCELTANVCNWGCLPVVLALQGDVDPGSVVIALDGDRSDVVVVVVAVFHGRGCRLSHDESTTLRTIWNSGSTGRPGSSEAQPTSTMAGGTHLESSPARGRGCTCSVPNHM